MYAFSFYLCFFAFLWSSSYSIVLKVLEQGKHFQLVVTDTLMSELASTTNTPNYYNYTSKLTGSFLFEHLFGDGF